MDWIDSLGKDGMIVEDGRISNETTG